MIEQIERVTGLDKQTLFHMVACDDVRGLLKVVNGVSDTGIHWYAKNALRLRLGAYSVDEVRGVILNDLYTEYNRYQDCKNKDITHMAGFVVRGVCLLVLVLIVLKVWLHLLSIL